MLQPLIVLALVFLTGCAAKQAPEPVEYVPEERTVAQPVESTDTTEPEEKPEGTIDLGFKGGRGKVSVRSSGAKAPIDYSCKKTSDCADHGLSDKKSASWKCVESKCVLKSKLDIPKNDLEPDDSSTAEP